VKYLRGGQADEAVQAFKSAYRLGPTDGEIVNNLGYAHLNRDEPQAAEPLLLLALVLEPGRANAWANPGESYAKQGRRSQAPARLARAYRCSKNRDATRQFFSKWAEDDAHHMSEIARRVLALRLVKAKLKTSD